MLYKYLSIFSVAFIELWAAIPMGIGFKIHPILIILISSLGAFSGAILVIVFGSKIQKLIAKNYTHSEKKETKEKLIQKIWKNYGVIGLGLLSPLITGAPIGIALGILFNAKKRDLLIFTSIGILFWSTFLTFIGYYGSELFTSLIK